MNVDMLVAAVLSLWLGSHMWRFVWWFALRDWVQLWRRGRVTT